MNDRLNIKKYCEINNNENMGLYSKVSWSIDVEYYSLAEIDREKVESIYKNIVNRIEKRREELMQEV